MTLEIDRRALLFTVAAASAAAGGGAAAAPADTAKSILQQTQRADSLPGAVAAVARAGRLLWSEGVGLASLELQTPAAPDHKFRYGSCSKVVTAAVAARLSERAAVDLDAPIARYMPRLPEQHRQTTLLQLFSHQGRVRHYIPRDFDRTAPGGAIDQRIYRTNDDILGIFINDPPAGQPGAFHYSTFGYTLISLVLEAAAQRPFLDLIRSEVSEPLGLEITGDVFTRVTPGRAGLYQRSARYRPMLPMIDADVINAPQVNPAYKWAGGGLMGRARDLAMFGAAHLTPGYLRRETLERLFTPILPMDAAGTHRVGIGWRISPNPSGGRILHHAGNIEGGRSGVAIFPEKGLAAAFVTNIGEVPQDPIPILTRMAEAFAA